MKKILIILSVLVIAAFGAWLILRDSEIPIVETIVDGLPFGSGEDINIPALSTSEDTVGETTSFDDNITAEDKLFRISNTPVAGFTTFGNLVRYVDRATGHIYEVNLETNGKIKITNQTLPKIYEAYFRPDGNAVLFRSLENDSSGVVENLSLALTPPQSTSTDALYTVSSTLLRGDINSVAVGSGLPAQAGNTLFYVLRDTNAIVSSTFTGTSLRTLFQSAFDNWRLERAGNNLLVYTEASANAPGFAYFLNSAGGSLSKILGPLQGLTAIANSNGSRILYSYFENNGTKLFVKNSQTGASSEILPSTLAEKCIWSSKEVNTFFCGTPLIGLSGQEPDNWYLGKTHFSDYIWRFDTNSETAQLVSNPKTDFDIDLDVLKPKLSSNEDYLVFINKTDQTLWAIRLN
ncbi:MAG: hypothetical protein HYT69_01250 [Candidatus Zambryskibacteria bacterium]|nr:hypothetical protein [Candidatus Zambryskibacteria bacterium]